LTLPNELERARAELHDAKPSGWYVGSPTYVQQRGAWEQYSFDTSEGARAGHRSREWTAVGGTEVEVVREMARCLQLIREGRPGVGATRDSEA
jgi:hypothetical protein